MELLIEHLVKSFGAASIAVNDVSLTVADGEFVVLLGPSGCGKTTTLRCVAGFENPDSGRISIGGQVVTAPEDSIFVPPDKRHLGMVFQSYAIWPHMTVFDNVAFGLQVRRRPKSEIEPRVKECLELVGLGHLGSRGASQLSGGQQQRVALARALAVKPTILLLDEPLSNLDAALRHHLRFELKEIQRRTGVTAIYVTHDQAEAVVLGDRIAVMSAGKIVQLAAPTELYTRPANAFVAEFTGASNILRGTAGEVDNGLRPVKVGDEIIVHAERSNESDGIQVGEQVQVLLRPENLRLTRDRAGAPRNVWPAQVVRPQYLGTQTNYIVRLGGDEVNVVSLGSRVEFRSGDDVYLQIDPHDVSTFKN